MVYNEMKQSKRIEILEKNVKELWIMVGELYALNDEKIVKNKEFHRKQRSMKVYIN